MTRRILRTLRFRMTAPAWAVHFHADGESGNRACFDERCGRAPLSTD